MTTTSRTHLFAGSLITWHTTAEDTGGAYSMAEAYCPPAPNRPSTSMLRDGRGLLQ